MKRTSFRSWPCSLARSVDLLGDWWTPLVLREAFFGSRRFDEFQQALGIGRNVLAARLRRLVAEGLLERRLYQERPRRYEYVLSESGRDFLGVLAALMRWGDRWLDRGRGAPVQLLHRRCGARTHAEVVCAECGERLAAEDLDFELGPGFPKKLAAKERVRRLFGGRRPPQAEATPG